MPSSSGPSPADEFNDRWNYQNPAWPWTGDNQTLDSTTEMAGKKQTGGANLLAALSGAAQAEEVRPGSGGAARILGMHQRFISELQARVSRIEATK